MTQSEVASRLGLSNSRAHRAIAKAHALGLVQVTVDAAAVSLCVELENAIASQYGLTMCRVAMELPEQGEIPLRALGALGAEWFGDTISSGRHKLIGVSHGRTIAAAVEAMARRDANGVAFVSLLGGLTRSLAANPYDVIHRLAQKTGGDAYLMPAPLFADTPADKDVMLSQRILHEAFEKMGEATLNIVGIGDLATSAGLSVSALDGSSAVEDLRNAGACAEILGQFIDADGGVMNSPVDGRVMALPLEKLRDREVVAIAGGASKCTAIHAVLKSKLLTGLIIDEATARSLVERADGNGAVAAE
ncbi:MAG: sugar-binding domain-containing protein [Pseudomonadota bacterium]